MDAWCALWLWPLDKADLLPSRAEFLQGMAMILEGGFTPMGRSPRQAWRIPDPAPDFFDLLDPTRLRATCSRRPRSGRRGCSERPMLRR